LGIIDGDRISALLLGHDNILAAIRHQSSCFTIAYALGYIRSGARSQNLELVEVTGKLLVDPRLIRLIDPRSQPLTAGIF
jgi:hypothetical protein